MGGCVPVVIHRREELDLPDSDNDNNNNNNNNNKNPNPYPITEVKLYHHTNSKWVVEEELVGLYYVREMLPDYDSDDWDWERERDYDDDSDDGKQYEYDIEKEEPIPDYYWSLKIGLKVRVKFDYNLQLKAFKDQKRVDFVADGVWAVKFYSEELYENFIKRYQDCLFENTFMYRANDENMLKVYGEDFIGWAKPETVDDSMWEESLVKGEEDSGQDLTDEFEEAVMDGVGAIQSLAMGALDNSFLVTNSGIQVVRNYRHGIQGKGIYMSFDDGRSIGTKVGVNTSYSTPKKALLMRAETNMLLMSPMDEGKPHSKGLHQLDIETGRIVSEWKFEKAGADISMRDITNDSKGAQIDPSGSTFLGLDDNRLCRWDMRDRKGVVQNLVNERTPVLNWTEGHQFSEGTNFQCFATTGDGSIVVGSLDGKIRLYSVCSMSQDKTAFPGLGLPITHVDVTYDGKWILGTTDTYLILICSLSTDKDGNTKTGFTGRMGNRIAAPRLLKLTPIDSHMAGANKFHDAQFSWVTENGKQEQHLVATVGKFSVIWNFQQVKDSSHQCYQNQVGFKSCYCYKIVRRDDSIVESRFMHEKFAFSDSPEAPLVVATPKKVSSFSISSNRLHM